MKMNDNMIALNSATLDYRPFTVFLFIRAAVFATSTENLHYLRNKTGEHRLEKQTDASFSIATVSQ